jgi:hypothetical protein
MKADDLLSIFIGLSKELRKFLSPCFFSFAKTSVLAERKRKKQLRWE